jgi:hemoglobin/transferrin/lactoferrin receptor protein
VRIYGFEGRLDQQLYSGWRLRGSFAWTKGRDLETGLPIIQINPATGVLGLSYERGPFRIESLVTAAMRKTARESRGVNRLLLPPGYTVMDLLAQWKFARTGRLSVGIFNLLDEKYWQWADVPVNDAHTADSVGGPDRYTRPGRNFSMSLSYQF